MSSSRHSSSTAMLGIKTDSSYQNCVLKITMLILTFTPVSNSFVSTLGNASCLCELSQTNILRSTKKSKKIYYQ